MTSAIEILESTPFNSVQDLGRPHHLASGVSMGGALDRLAAQIANAMAGNPDDAACLEISHFPFRLRFHRRMKVALTGADCNALLSGRALPPWWTLEVQVGNELTLDAPSKGCCSYLAVSGGIRVPSILGSRATDMKSGFGGVDGRGLRTGDRLEVDTSTGPIPHGEFGIHSRYPLLPRESPTPLRVIAAAELDVLTESSRIAFSRERWQITRAINRTGARLEGPRLSLSTPRDVLSYGVVPGLIQLLPSGDPVVQLAEANTCGGYPRIATVIRPDLRLLVQTPPGAYVSFELIEHASAIAALTAERNALVALKQSLSRAAAA